MMTSYSGEFTIVEGVVELKDNDLTGSDPEREVALALLYQPEGSPPTGSECVEYTYKPTTSYKKSQAGLAKGLTGSVDESDGSVHVCNNYQYYARPLSHFSAKYIRCTVYTHRRYQF